MDRLRMYEYAVNRVLYLESEIQRAESEIPDLIDELQDTEDFLSRFKYSNDISYKAYKLVCDFGIAPDILKASIERKNDLIARSNHELNIWIHMRDKLREMWPEIVEELEK